jgi:hypothetical protein
LLASREAARVEWCRQADAMAPRATAGPPGCH